MNTTNWHQLHQPGMGSISSMALSAELHTVLSNCLIQNSTGYSYYSWKTSSWQMVTRLLHTYFHSDPLEEAKVKSRGWDVCQKKASHNSNSCWSMVTSLSPPLQVFGQLQLHNQRTSSRLPFLPGGLQKFHSKKTQIFF